MLLRDATALRAPSGWEDEAREAFRREAEARLAGREGRVFADTMGNLFAVRKGNDPNKRRVMLCAHMDEVGFIVRFATEDGLLKFACVGGVDPRALVSKRVLVGKDAVPGVIGFKAVHLMEKDELERPPKLEELSIDVGASSREEAERLCPRGSYATFDSDYVEFGDGFVKAKALDDRVGCLLLLDALADSAYAGDLVCAFTVQEEAGMRGAKVAGSRVKPDVAVVLEGTFANDLGKSKSHERSTECGKGPAITHMDGGVIADKALRRLAVGVAERRGIPCQYRRMTSGYTDAGALHLTGAGIPTLTLAVPCRYIHSGASVCKLADIDAARKLLLAVLEEL